MSKQQFVEFKEEAMKWVKEMGLQHMELTFKHGCPEGALATAMFYRESLDAILSLSKKLPKRINISRLALHEVLHLAIWELTEETNEDKKDKLEHELINRISNLITQ